MNTLLSEIEHALFSHVQSYGQTVCTELIQQMNTMPFADVKEILNNMKDGFTQVSYPAKGYLPSSIEYLFLELNARDVCEYIVNIFDIEDNAIIKDYFDNVSEKGWKR